jgi:mono/diheme cytochrome c family protein
VLFALSICVLPLLQSVECAFGQATQSKVSSEDPSVSFTAEQVRFFESRIRPLLVQHCLECHSGEEAESGLRLDSREAILAGGQSGPAAVVGAARKSLLVSVVNHSGPYQMPPPGKLDEELINDLVQWVDAGLPWPATSSNIEVETIQQRMDQHRQQHWAFQRIVKPTIEVKSGTEDLAPIDQIVGEGLNKQQLSFSPRADRRTLIRRATMDLTGVPPTPEETESFISDSSSDAWTRLVNRLLDSPRYGQRWARHWLDVARYSDTSGYTFNMADRSNPYAWTYRDYVVDAFNADLPYDQFIREQLAADYLDLPENSPKLAALGFITVGRQYIKREDTLDDQVDVVTRGLMGLTVSCARCHDHKYDAIPTEDYYSLYGIFNNCHSPDELPLIGDGATTDQGKKFLSELEEVKNELPLFRENFLNRTRRQLRDHVVDYCVYALADENMADLTAGPNVSLKRGDLNAELLKRIKTFFNDEKRLKDSPLRELVEYLKLPEVDFSSEAERVFDAAKQNGEATIINASPTTKLELAVRVGSWLSTALADEEQIANLKLPFSIAETEVEKYYGTDADKRLSTLRSNIVAKRKQAPPAIRRAMTLREKEPATNVRVMLRGNINSRGEVAPRQFPALLNAKRTPFKDRAGRLELAEAILDESNPLTARVMANRIWMHHFDKPLVATPGDFGIRCPQPKQHALLDFLASRLIEMDWSIKELHRTIMLSRVYTQSSNDRPEATKVDPENELLWRMNRRRLEFESLRDSILAVAGTLDDSLGGRAAELFAKSGSENVRRTIYGRVDRQDLPNVFRTFDFASPDQSTVSRVRTFVPQQSLFMLNHPFVMQQAKLLAARASRNGQQDLKTLFRLVLQRDPDDLEQKRIEGYLAGGEPSEEGAADEESLTRWQRVAHILLCCNEFEFID